MHAAPPPAPHAAAFRECADPDSEMRRCSRGMYGSPAPESPSLRAPVGFADIYPPNPAMPPVAQNHAMEPWPPAAAGVPYACADALLAADADPLMSKSVADTGQNVAAESLLAPTRHQQGAGGHAFVHSAPGGQNSMKRDVNGNIVRGPVASPNTQAALLPTNRHKVYPMAPDRFVQPVPIELVPSPSDYPCTPPPLPPPPSPNT